MLFLPRWPGTKELGQLSMSFDNRYPWLHRIAHAPDLSAQEKRRAQAIAKRIGDNTGLSCAYNARTGALFFYYGSPHGGPFAMPFFDRDTRTCRIPDDAEIGDYIRLAKLGQLSPQEKAAIADRNRREEEYQHRVRLDKHTDERRPSMEDYAAWKDKKRRGTTKLVSA